MFKDELIDLVDKHDNVVGQIMRSEAYAQKLFPSMRAVWLNIKTKDGLFWIPRRSPHKKVLPNHLDGSVIGHVAAGQTYEDAVVFAAQNEVNLDLKGKIKQVGKLTPHEHNSFCMYAIYELEVDEPFDVNFSDKNFSEGTWMSAQDIVDAVARKEQMKEMLPFVFNHFYGIEF